jgi:hypothetical protein
MNRLFLMAALPALLPAPRLSAEENKAQPATIRWEADYLQAMDRANQERKMLAIFFEQPGDPAWQKLKTETLGNPDVQRKLQAMICLRLPLDAKTCIEGKDVVLLQHPSLREMLNRPGLAIVDFAHDDPKLHGMIVSTFPLTGRLSYGPAEMNVILDLPAGTLTQRTLIYAVRTHPERPASALGCPDNRLLVEAESHSQCQARICRLGHHGWGSRFPRIAALVGGAPREVCAESWPGQNLVESAIECVRCWRLSSGHWNAVQARNRSFAYDMKLGCNGVWYATGIVAAD